MSMEREGSSVIHVHMVHTAMDAICCPWLELGTGQVRKFGPEMKKIWKQET
jgi:hypothetical protein